jgi:DnaJ domain
MSLDPYEALGVPHDAPTAEVKRAYRKRAKQAHPDGGGTAEEFEKISRAMLILTDPKRRAKYDATGDADDVAPDNSVALAVSIIVGFVSQVISQYVSGAAGDPCTVDLIDVMRKHFKKQMVDFENQKVPIIKAAKAMERVEKRFKARKKSNPMLLHALRHPVDLKVEEIVRARYGCVRQDRSTGARRQDMVGAGQRRLVARSADDRLLRRKIMTIHRDHGNVVFECDGCDDTFTIDDPDFALSWTAAKRDNWITRKIGPEWHHYCPNCGEGFR